MRAGFIIALSFLSGVEALPQGQVIFNNRVNGVVVAPVFGPEPSDPERAKQGNSASGTPAGTQTYSGPLLQGRDYTAQLFGGPTNAATADLLALGSATFFRWLDGAGFVEAPDFPVNVPGVPEGTPAKLLLRAWDNNNGALTNWQQLLTNRWIPRGQSLPFISRPLGSALVLPPNLEGLQSFNLALPMGVAALLPSIPANLQAKVISSTRIDLSWTDTSTNEMGFRIERSFDGIAFTPLDVTASNVSLFSSVGLRPGIRHHYRVRAFNSTGESSYSNTNYATTMTPFAEWQLARFTPAQLTNAAFAGPGDDPDADELPNFAEYALDREPLVAEVAPPARAVLEQSSNRLEYLALVYARNKAAIDAEFQAEASSNLSTWQAGSNAVLGPIPVNETDATVTEKFRDNLPVGAFARRFLRLKVSETGVRDSWKTNTLMPVALDEVACGIIGRRLYVVGGGNAATLAFDLPTSRWTNLGAARPFPGNHHAAEVLDGKLYLCGGLGGGAEGKLQIFDPATNGWSLGTPMPFAAGSCASAVMNDSLYVAGGIVNGGTTDALAQYDPVGTNWTRLAPMPQGRNHAAAGTDGSFLYVFGGRGGNNFLANGSDTVQIYDSKNDTWVSSANPGSPLAPLPQYRGGMGKAVFFNQEFYVMGGETASGPGATAQRVYNRVDIYHPASNTWRQGTPMLTARHGIYPVLDHRRIYVAGGGVVAGDSSSALLEVYITP